MTGPDLPRRVAVLGAGWIARHVHVPLLLEQPFVDEVIVSDVDSERAARLGAEFGVRVAGVAAAVDDADLVIVATPPDTHAELAVHALSAGRATVIEKPLTTTAEDAWRVIEAARASSSRVHACYTNRFRRDVVALTELVTGGEVGEVTDISARWLRGNGVPGTDGARAVGVLWDLGSHLVDVLLGLLPGHAAGTVVGKYGPTARIPLRGSWYGDPDSVARTVAVRPDFAGGVFFDDGPAAQLRLSWRCATVLDRVEVDVVGTAGTASLRTVFGFSPDRQRLGGPALSVVDARTGRRRVVIPDQSREPVEYRDQLGAVLTEPTDWAGLERAAAAVSLCAAAAHSATTNAPARFALNEKEVASVR